MTTQIEKIKKMMSFLDGTRMMNIGHRFVDLLPQDHSGEVVYDIDYPDVLLVESWIENYHNGNHDDYKAVDIPLDNRYSERLYNILYYQCLEKARNTMIDKWAKIHLKENGIEI